MPVEVTSVPAGAILQRETETMLKEDVLLQPPGREGKNVPDQVIYQAATGITTPAPHLPSKSEKDDAVAGWILMTVVVGLTLLTAALMQIK